MIRRPEVQVSRRAHVLVWVGAGLIYFLALLPFFTGPVTKLAGFKVVWALVGWGVGESLLVLFRRGGLFEAPVGRAALVIALVAPIAGALWLAVMTGVSIAIQGDTLLIFTPTLLPFVLMNHVFIVLAWAGGHLALTYWRRSQVEARLAAEALSAARAAELQALRLQLNPHFLFNSLASLRALIQEDQASAREMVSRISSFLRSALRDGPSDWATVAEEFEMLRDYAAIEKVRFEERLHVEWSLHPDAEDARLPAFLLLSLVENAFEHGERVDGVLRVHIEAEIEGDALALSVRNTGTLEAEAGRRIGLRNVEARLASAFPPSSTAPASASASFDIRRNGAWVEAAIRVPVVGLPDRTVHTIEAGAGA